MKNKNYSLLFPFVLLTLSILSFACDSKPATTATPIIETPNNNQWNGKKSAIALTYDDGLHVHLDNVVPMLDSNNLKGTFYVHTDADSFKKRKAKWKAIADNGHELGNHSVFHPCAGQSKGREWVSPEKDLDTYSHARILAEIEKANAELSAIDGKKQRTYAYTCGDTSVLDTSFVQGVSEIFTAARGVHRDFNSLETVEQYYMDAHSMNGHSAEHMKSLVDKAIKEERLLIFLFHGVGGEHDLNVDKAAHDELIEYIKAKEKNIWVGTLVDISTFIEGKS